MLLYLQTKNWLSVWFYYSTTSYFWFFVDGIFAQALVSILFLLVFVLKDWRLQVLLLPLAILSHGHGFLLITIAIVLSNLGPSVKSFFPCSGVFGFSKPLILDQPIPGLVTTGIQFNVGNALIVPTKIFPFPFAFFALRQAWKDKEFHVLGLTIVTLVAGLVLSHRIFYLLPLILIPSLVKWVSKLNQTKRHVVLFSTILVFGFQLYSWLNSKLVCSI